MSETNGASSVEYSYFTGIINKFNFRFLFADCSIPVAEVIRRNDLKASSAILVAKTMIASFFLAGMVKDDTTVNIQLEGDGVLERVMAYSDRYGKMRGHAKYSDIDANDDKTLGIGKGFFKVARWGGPQKLQQSVTKLEPEVFEANLLKHISESDQQISFISIHVDPEAPGNFSRGIIFQALPFTTEMQIEEFSNLLGEVDAEPSQLLSGGMRKVLDKFELILDSDFEILESGNTEFFCGCSIEKIKKIVISLGEEDANELLEEHGKVEITCEFCKEVYSLNEEEVKSLFLR